MKFSATKKKEPFVAPDASILKCVEAQAILQSSNTDATLENYQEEINYFDI